MSLRKIEVRENLLFPFSLSLSLFLLTKKFSSCCGIRSLMQFCPEFGAVRDCASLKKKTVAKEHASENLPHPTWDFWREVRGQLQFSSKIFSKLMKTARFRHTHSNSLISSFRFHSQSQTLKSLTKGFTLECILTLRISFDPIFFTLQSRNKEFFFWQWKDGWRWV